MDKPEIAIDFGTARTKVAYFDQKLGEPRLIELGRDHPRFIPSVFHVGRKEEGGKVLVGDEAQRRLYDDPEGIINNLKLAIDDPRKRTIAADRPRIRNSELLVQLLTHIRQLCQDQQFHQEVRFCSITVPVVFEEPKREAIQIAARTAGFEQIRLEHEPVAAAKAWLAGSQEHLPDHIVVCDVGGGTTDFALVHRRGSRLEPDAVVLPSGFPAGGNHLDEDVWALLRSSKSQEIDETKKALYLHEIKRAKEDLANSVVKDAKLLHTGDVVLSHQLLSDCCKDFVDEITDQVSNYLDRCRKDGGVSDPAVLLVGGGSRCPGLKENLEELRIGKVFQWLNSEWAPVLGAALPRDFRLDRRGEGARHESPDEEKYREAVRVAWIDNNIDRSELDNLSFYSAKLEITPEDAARIEREEIGQTKEDVYNQSIQSAYSDVLDRTRSLIIKGKGHEAFSLAEEALADTESNDALDAWIESMGTIASKERILESSSEIAARVKKTDLLACVQIAASTTAEACEFDRDRCLEWLEPLGEEVRTYPHAIAAFLFFTHVPNSDAEQKNEIADLIAKTRPNSCYALVSQIDTSEITSTKPTEIKRLLTSLSSVKHSPLLLGLAYYLDFLVQGYDIQGGGLSKHARDEIVETLTHIAWGTFGQKLVALLDAFQNQRVREFMQLTNPVLESSFCDPGVAALIHRLISMIHQNSNPPQYKDAVSAWKNAVSLDEEEDGSGFEEWSCLLIAWGLTETRAEESRKRFEEAVDVCQKGIEDYSDNINLLNQSVIARINLVRFYLYSPTREAGKSLNLANQQIEKAFDSSQDHYLRFPENPVSESLFFSCCMLRVDLDNIGRVFPQISPETLKGAIDGYLGSFIQEDEIVMFLYDQAFFKSGAVGLAVTTRRIVANTRFAGQTHVQNWQTASFGWNGENNTVLIHGTPVPHGTEIGQQLYEGLKLFRETSTSVSLNADNISPVKQGDESLEMIEQEQKPAQDFESQLESMTPAPLPSPKIAPEHVRECPHGHGPLREWEGEMRCWTCGWTPPKSPPPLPARKVAPEPVKECPGGHGPLKEWEGEMRCWTCGWTDTSSE